MTNPAGVHPVLLERLASGYREFIESNPPTFAPIHTMEWSPMFRQFLPDLGQRPPVPVGSARTIELGTFSVRVMTPEGAAPGRGWPALLYLHGGGWVLGDATTQDGVLSRICVGAKCVTVSVEYRLAPEHPFPAGLDDCWNALLWLYGDRREELNVDPKRIALGGDSSGGNFAAVLAQRASLASPRLPLVLQMLIDPAVDTSFSASDRSAWTPSMLEHENIFALPTLDLLWFRDQYLPNIEDRTRPDASPNYQTNKEAFEGTPPAWIAVAELDILRSDGEKYADKLRSFGVPVTLKLLKGFTHTTVSADRVCEAARLVCEEQIQALKAAFV